MKKRNAVYASGSLRELSRQRVYKPVIRDKLAGFYKTPSRRGVFVPLGQGNQTLVVK